MSKIKGIFVTGTDTGVGKTMIVGLLARYLLRKGYRVVTQKWIQTGGDGFSRDISLHLKIMGKDKNYIKDYFSEVNPYIFKLAGSAHLASGIEKKRIQPRKIIKSFQVLARKFDLVIIEGIGGVLVPFDRKHLVIDIVRKLHLSVLLVAQNKLGAINHTLLTVEALRKRKIKILGIVFNNLNKQNPSILKDNPFIIKQLTKEKILGVLPWVNKDDKLYQYFIPIGEKIRKQLRYG